jgi:hypothetical protein
LKNDIKIGRCPIEYYSLRETGSGFDGS